MVVVKEKEVSITSPAGAQRVNTRGWTRTYFALACRPQIVWMNEATKFYRDGASDMVSGRSLRLVRVAVWPFDLARSRCMKIYAA